MGKNLFSIDIHGDFITGVLFHLSPKEIGIIGCGTARIGTRSLQEVLREVMAQAGFQDGGCRISFPTEQFFFRNVSLPFTDIGKIRKILPFELEESAPMEIRKLLVDAITAKSDEKGSEVIAVMAQRQFLAEKLALLQDLGLDPEIVTVSGLQTAARLSETDSCPPDFILLDIGLMWARMIVVLDKKIALIRPLSLDEEVCVPGVLSDENPSDTQQEKPTHPQNGINKIILSIKRTSHFMKIGRLPIFLTGPNAKQNDLVGCLQEALGVEVKCCDLLKHISRIKVASDIKSKWIPGIMDQALALGLRQGRSRKWLNFRKDEFARKISIKQYRHLITKIAAGAAVLVLIIVSSLWYGYVSRKAEENRLAGQIRAVFSQTLPTVSRIEDPIQQLQTEIIRLKQATNDGGIGNNHGVLDIFAEISRLIPKSLNVRLSLMVVEGRNVRLKGTTDNFNTVDNIKKKLEKSLYFSAVTISSANLAPKGNEIRFELKLQLNGA